MGAFALCREIGIPSTDFERALQTFVKPPHRIEFVAKIRGVNFFNDSKGTNIDAVVRAVASMEGKVVLIAGGMDKNVSCRPWNEAFGDKVKSICAIGQTKEKIKRELDHPVILCSDLESAVYNAFSIAEEGDNVLLSPGYSSFDMFRHYQHRGEEFRRLVGEIGHE